MTLSPLPGERRKGEAGSAGSRRSAIGVMLILHKTPTVKFPPGECK